MAAGITAAVQATTPKRVIVTVTGLAGASSATVYRVAGSQRTPVRPAPIPASIIATGTAVLTDVEAPFNVDVSYVVSVTRAGVTTDEATTTAPVRLAEAIPWLTDPFMGQGLALVILTWPAMEWGQRTAVANVAGRDDPIAESDVPTWPQTTLTLTTTTQADLRSLRALAAAGQVLLLRAVCDGVEDAYLAVTGRTETRIGTPGPGWARYHEWRAQLVDAPAIGLAATGDTLDDLHDTVPTTLQDIAVAWPGTLLDIAQTNLGSL